MIENEMKCKNCANYQFGRCSQDKDLEIKDSNIDCVNGLFDTLNVKEKLKEAYLNIMDLLDYYMDMPDDQKNIITLWVIGTYFHKNFNAFPYLFINAMRGSGKTRLLKIITAVAKQGQLLNSLTDAVLFRTVGTLGIDEFEGLGHKDKTSLRELLNSGYKKGTKVFRMKKKKSVDGEEQVVEAFEPYRPIVLANIWGMEEVLGDRCICVVLEKSLDSSKTKLIENFSDILHIKSTEMLLLEVSKCSLCSVVSPENIYKQWNDYVKSIYTLTTLTTITTLNHTNYTKNNEELFNKINETEVDGRHLELFLPLFLIASEIEGPEILEKTLKYAKRISQDKKMEELTESKDVMLYTLVSKEEPGKWKSVKALTSVFKLMIGEELEWLNSKWIGRALKRLNLVKEKRRVSDGIEVMLDIEKAKLKEKIFK